ncbi:hypothetical protein QNA14_10740, partial [Dietzia kunjamensis]|uniref:hypothetical protein n=1 Tax=Dietzia kunjamensis TaxID=322509 RepID=UPI0024BB5F57
MKNSKRMMAVIAASGLVLGGMPGIANAQGTGSAELGLNLGGALGSGELALDLGLALGSDATELPDLEDLPTGSDGLLSGSTGEDAPDFGSITEGSTGEDAPDFGSITEGST